MAPKPPKLKKWSVAAWQVLAAAAPAVIFLAAVSGAGSAATSRRQIPEPRDPGLVLVDQSVPAYTVFLAIPIDAPDDKVEALSARIADNSSVSLMTWEEFQETKKMLFGSRIVSNDYPRSRALEGMTELLRRYPETPFGLTWNGGVAVTFSDYQHAEDAYQEFLADPDAYSNSRPEDPRADPVNPRWHFQPLLGWEE